MAQRQELQSLLETLCDNVYFQPPINIRLVYPCIIYSRDHVDIKHADNRPYNHKTRYVVTVIDRDPDSDIPSKVAELPTTSFNRFYTSDNLNHDVYSVYF